MIKTQKNVKPSKSVDSNTFSPPKNLALLIENAWKIIAPYWSLSNQVAVNPLQGLENLSFESALNQGAQLFQRKDYPDFVSEVNRQTIKWCQVLLDQGQASICLPNKQQGLFKAWLSALPFDSMIHQHSIAHKNWLKGLSDDVDTIIYQCVLKLRIPKGHWPLFFKLMLTTLWGWASYIQQINSGLTSSDAPNLLSKQEYLALRLILTCLLSDHPKALIDWYERHQKEYPFSDDFFKALEKRESAYCQHVLNLIDNKTTTKSSQPPPSAQFIFCIDVRSEPIRRAIESLGPYQTYGMAGFFNLPVSIHNHQFMQNRNACPVLITPKHKVSEHPTSKSRGKLQFSQLLRKMNKNLKYCLTTPFALAESSGLLYGMLLFSKTLFPKKIDQFLQKHFPTLEHQVPVELSLEAIPLSEKVHYAHSVLKSIGLTQNFARKIILCGHNSTNKNNAFNSLLQCGACGGSSGSTNAQLMANILNDKEVRQHLQKLNIYIPKDSEFIGASHNTTTDEIVLFNAKETQQLPKPCSSIQTIQRDLKKVQLLNAQFRSQFLDKPLAANQAKHLVEKNASDWAQIRPEWGLAKNSAFIVAPRHLTEGINLDGRTFLHSYEYQDDKDFETLTSILTAPVIVAFWINSQYFFSTLDNTAYGAGSKITKNITGKFAVMQGNASDLMMGLPLQSVFKTNEDPYHELVRLQVLIHAPLNGIQKILHEHPSLKNLCLKGWIKFICLDPVTHQRYQLTRTNQWSAL